MIKLWWFILLYYMILSTLYCVFFACYKYHYNNEYLDRFIIIHFVLVYDILYILWSIFNLFQIQVHQWIFSWNYDDSFVLFVIYYIQYMKYFRFVTNITTTKNILIKLWWFMLFIIWYYIECMAYFIFTRNIALKRISWWNYEYSFCFYCMILCALYCVF